MKEAAKFTLITQGIIALFVVGIILYQLQAVLLPFVIAVFLSYIFKPLVLFLERRKVPMIFSLVIVLITVAVLIAGVSLFVYASAQSFIAALPHYEERMTSIITDLVHYAEQKAQQMNIDISSYKWTSLVQGSSVTGLVTTGVGSFLSYISDFILILLFMMFLLAGSGQMSLKIKSSFSFENSARIASIIENIDIQVRQYLLAKTLVSLLMGVVTVIILFILGVDFPLLWGALAFALNFIPNIGTAISAIFPFLLACLQFDSFGIPLLLLILLIAAHNVIGNVLEPKLMANSLNMSPVLVLIALLFWGWLWGIWGMILAVPITSMIKIVCENIEVLKPIAALMSSRVNRPPGTVVVRG